MSYQPLHGHGHGHGGGSHGHGGTEMSKVGSANANANGSAAPPKKKGSVFTPALLIRSFRYAWPKNNLSLRVQLVVSLTLAALGSLCDLLPPIATRYAIDALVSPEPSLPLHAILFYGASRFGGTFFGQLRDALYAPVAAHSEYTIALDTFRHIQSLSLSFHLKRETGSILRSVSRGSQSFGTLLRIVLFQIAPIFFQLIVVCSYLLSQLSWYYSFLTFVVIALYLVFTFTTTEWRDKHRRVMNEKDNEYNQRAIDALLNYETVKFFNAEVHEENRYGAALLEYAKANVRTQQSLAFLNSGQNLLISSGLTVAMVLSGQQVIEGEMTIGDFVMVQAFILQLYQPLGFLGTYYRMLKQQIVDVEAMFSLLSEPVDLHDSPTSRPLRLTSPTISFQNVSFSYTPTVPILKSLSFDVPAGTKLAIVGSSGAGKSTIARLLYRFFDISGGRILIGGVDVRDITQASLRREIAIIPQDTVLFNDTIRYNISYGGVADGREILFEDIEEAAKSAEIDPFVRSQPLGFDTKVGERGLRLSGGERQRMSIARAILKKAKILVCDEATSSLDSNTESAIQTALDNLSKRYKMTTVTIAHRLSTIMNFDQIIVLHQGHIIERGTHNELIAIEGGYYAKLWDKQRRAQSLMEQMEDIKREEVKVEVIPKEETKALTVRTEVSSKSQRDMDVKIQIDNTDSNNISNSRFVRSDEESDGSESGKKSNHKGKPSGNKSGKDLKDEGGNDMTEPLL